MMASSWLVAGPASSSGVAGSDLAELADELAWAAVVEDVEEPAPGGDVEGLDELGGTVGEPRGAAQGRRVGPIL
jgi:hypothetical protein